MPLNVNFHLASGLRTTDMTKFEFNHLEELSLSVNIPLASGPRTTCMTKFELKHLEDAIKCKLPLCIWSKDNRYD